MHRPISFPAILVESPEKTLNGSARMRRKLTYAQPDHEFDTVNGVGWPGHLRNLGRSLEPRASAGGRPGGPTTGRKLEHGVRGQRHGAVTGNAQSAPEQDGMDVNRAAQ